MPKNKPSYNERDAKTGQFVEKGTEKKRPARTVRERRPPNKRDK